MKRFDWGIGFLFGGFLTAVISAGAHTWIGVGVGAVSMIVAFVLLFVP